MKKKILILVTLVILTLTLIAVPVFATSTHISNTLVATTNTVAMDGQVAMTWSQDNGDTFNNAPLTLGVVVGVPVVIQVKSVSMVSVDIPKVLFVIESSDVYTITYVAGAETGTLTYNEVYGGYTFGPATGFTMTPGWNVTTIFTVTATEAGSNTASIYAIQLPE